MDVLTVFLLGMTGILFAGCVYFTAESFREQEARAVRNGLTLAGIVLIVGFLVCIPSLRPAIFLGYLLVILLGLTLLIPAAENSKALSGAKGYQVGEARRFDERDSVFVRYRYLPEGSWQYDTYYKTLHPEKEKNDAGRREKGFIGTPGSIDHQYQPNVAMMHASFSIPPFLGLHAKNDPEPGVSKAELSARKATLIVKNLAKHIGADMVGIAKINPDLIYSHRGETHYDAYDDWGKEIKDLPPYAVVMLTQMNHGHVISAPHTPTVAESAHLYARGAYLTTLLAKWFSHMGYKGVAQHTRNYDLPLPPLAADAGLGEVGRQGYLIAPRFGARVRIFAVLTDMPLIPDMPVSLGVEAFCQACKKCADSCPSKSIPQGEKMVYNGFEKWKVNEDSCFDYWSKVGTDCSICMAICPFSRPDTLLHRIVRRFVARSRIAQLVFPHVDNFLYGKRWRPKKVTGWLNYREKHDADEEY